MALPEDRLRQLLFEATDRLEGVAETCAVLTYCAQPALLSRLFGLINCGAKGHVTWDDVTAFCLDGAMLAKVHGERCDALCEWVLEPHGLRGFAHRPHTLRPMGTAESVIIFDRSDAVFAYNPSGDEECSATQR